MQFERWIVGPLTTTEMRIHLALPLCAFDFYFVNFRGQYQIKIKDRTDTPVIHITARVPREMARVTVKLLPGTPESILPTGILEKLVELAA